jgi:hypothetical protein
VEHLQAFFHQGPHLHSTISHKAAAPPGRLFPPHSLKPLPTVCVGNPLALIKYRTMAKPADKARLTKLMQGILARNPSASIAVIAVKFRFLSLPAEIRLKVYGFVFGDSRMFLGRPRPETRAAITRKHHPSWADSTFRHQILLTCRLCYTEARQLFYSSAVWKIGCYGPVCGFETCWLRVDFDPRQKFLSHQKYCQHSKWIDIISLGDWCDTEDVRVRSLPMEVTFAPCPHLGPKLGLGP